MLCFRKKGGSAESFTYACFSIAFSFKMAYVEVVYSIPFDILNDIAIFISMTECCVPQH